MRIKGKKAELFGKKYPDPDKISSRISTIARSMASTMMPRVPASAEDTITLLKVLKQDLKDLKCVYCGEKATELDHLYPLITDKIPTGYYTEPNNLVPCCHSCNTKKGNLNWKAYMEKIKNENIDEKQKYENLEQVLIAKEKEFPAKMLNLSEQIKQNFKELYEKAEALLSEIQKNIPPIQLDDGFIDNN